MTNDEGRYDVLIVGAGFSGALLAVHLLRKATRPLTVCLVERSEEIGRGVAYGTGSGNLLLNATAGQMSAFADEPDHFLRWLAERASGEQGSEAVPARAFVPRKVFGAYLQDVLREEMLFAKRGPQRLETIRDEAVGIEVKEGDARVRLAGGRALHAKRVVLALGNQAPLHPLPRSAVLERSPRYVGDPWKAGALDPVESRESVLLIGTGLTMVDMVAALKERGHFGAMDAVSRHGLLPRTHPTVPATWPSFVGAQPPRSVRALLRSIRENTRLAAARGIGWSAVVDSVRAHAREIWKGLPLWERERFLRHAKAYWDVHRHRVAPEVGDSLQASIASGRLTIHAGRLLGVVDEDAGAAVRFRLRGGREERVVLAQRVINCTGPGNDYTRLDHPLIASLIGQGLVRPHLLSGLSVGDHGELLDAEGNTSSGLYTVGAPTAGDFWEVTAVAELRRDVERLAERLLSLRERDHAPGRRDRDGLEDRPGNAPSELY